MGTSGRARIAIIASSRRTIAPSRQGPAASGKGAVDLAEAVAEACEETSTFGFLHPDTASLRDKIEVLATKVYGADGVDDAPAAARQLDAYETNGYVALPVCVAKTHLSTSSDPPAVDLAWRWWT